MLNRYGAYFRLVFVKKAKSNAPHMLPIDGRTLWISRNFDEWGAGLAKPMLIKKKRALLG
jgi:hypothetical protein